MLAMDELGELLWISLLQDVQRNYVGAQRLGETVEKLFSRIHREGLHQHFLRKIEAAADDEVARHGELVELVQDSFGLFAGDLADQRDFPGDALDVLLGKIFDQVAAGLFAQGDEQDGSLPDTRDHLGGFGVQDHCSSSRIQPSRTWDATPGSFLMESRRCLVSTSDFLVAAGGSLRALIASASISRC